MKKILFLFFFIPLFSLKTAHCVEQSDTQKIFSNYDDGSQISMEFNNVYNNMQRREFNISTTTPTPLTLRNGEFVIQATTSNLLCANINGNLVCFPSTANVGAFVASTTINVNSLLSGAMAPNLVAAWAIYSASATTLLQSYNVPSVTVVTNPGVYGFNFTNGFKNNVYSCTCSASFHSGVGGTICSIDETNPWTTTEAFFHIRDSAGSDYAPNKVTIVCSGNQ